MREELAPQSEAREVLAELELDAAVEPWDPFEAPLLSELLLAMLPEEVELFPDPNSALGRLELLLELL